MTDMEFQAFVEAHRTDFEGVHPHSASELDRFEHDLGHRLPGSLRWLLGSFGYSGVCGVENLDEAVQQTLQCRETISLPPNWLLLNDWGDGGIVLLDLLTGQTCWCGAHNAVDLAAGEIDSDSEWFSGYPDWVVSRWEAHRDG